MRPKSFHKIVMVSRMVMICLAVLAWTATAAKADQKNWDGVGDWTADAASCWSTGSVPTSATLANLRSGTVSINNETIATEYFWFGHDFDGTAADVTLNMTGGTVTASLDACFVGFNNATMTWNLSGGTVNVLRRMYMLYGASDSGPKSSAILNITGGELNIVGNLIFADEYHAHTPSASTRKAHIQLDGGTLSANAITAGGVGANGANIGGNAGGGAISMDITGGTLVLTGRVSSMGFVTAYGGKGSFVYDYDGEVPGKTVIRAITTPPPPVPAVTPTKPQKLRVVVGQPTTLTRSPTNINTDSITASRTGMTAVFYPQAGPRKMRVSEDAGWTWGPERDAPPHQGGAQEIGLREGGVLKLRSDTQPTKGRKGWYDLVTFKFTDDFKSYQTFTAKMHMPDHMDSLDAKEPGLSKGPIIQIPNGDLLMPMYAGLTGDSPTIHRAYIARSKDLGRTWSFYSTIAYDAVDPNPELPGQYAGYCEPTIALLSNGQLLAVLRSQLNHWGPNFRPLYIAWSNDMGLTWTKPIPAKVSPGQKHPYLYNISPTLAVLDNGVVALSYGRPGFHVAFSSDNGHTWGDLLHFSELPTESDKPNYIRITGQFDMVKAGPNSLVAVGSDNKGVLKVWPITVEIP